MRIVLDIPDSGAPPDTLRAFADALQAALTAAPQPAPPSPAPQPPAPPAPIPPAQWPYTLHPEIPKGDYSRRHFTAEHGKVDSFPFTVPAGPYAPKGPLVQTSVSENQGHPWLRIVAISRAPGDVAYQSALQWTRGKEGMLTLIAGVDAAVGETLYINTLIDEQGDPSLSTASGMSIVWSEANP